MSYHKLVSTRCKQRGIEPHSIEISRPYFGIIPGQLNTIDLVNLGAGSVRQLNYESKSASLGRRTAPPTGYEHDRNEFQFQKPLPAAPIEKESQSALKKGTVTSKK